MNTRITLLGRSMALCLSVVAMGFSLVPKVGLANNGSSTTAPVVSASKVAPARSLSLIEKTEISKATYSLYNCWWGTVAGDTVDVDGDGYARQRVILIDADTSASSASVYLRIYYRLNGASSWNLDYQTPSFTITGLSSTDAQGFYIGTAPQYPHGTYDFKVELYTAVGTLVATRDYSVDADLDNMNFETPAEDSSSQPALSVTPVTQFKGNTAGTTSFAVVNAGGGSLSWTASVTSGGTWARITSGASGSNGGTITVGYDANTSSNSRSATIDVTAAGATGSPATVSLVQAPIGGGAARRALLVGIDNYDPNFGPGSLPSCINDATGFRDIALLSDPGSRWPSEYITLLTDSQATKAAIRSQLQNLAATSQSGDLVVYFHSSHGGQTSGRDTFICSYDANYTDAELGSDLALFASTVNVIVIVDACYSGGLFKQADAWPFVKQTMTAFANAKAVQYSAVGLSAPKSLGQNVAFMTACDYNELSWAGNPYSLYAGYVIRGSTNAAADVNGNNQRDFLEVHSYAASHASASQTAQSTNTALLQATILQGVVGGGGNGGTATRAISGSAVTIDVAPSFGTSTWGLEEVLPAGLTPANITGNNGSWNTFTRKITWSATGSSSATLGYSLTGAAGTYGLSGTASFDGVDQAVTGDSQVILDGAIETVSEPTTPSGASSGLVYQSLNYSTTGAVSSFGHAVQYQFDWGDGSQSGWGEAIQSKSWSSAGGYGVKARARCATDTSITSTWSTVQSVVMVAGVPVIVNPGSQSLMVGVSCRLELDVRSVSPLTVAVKGLPSGLKFSASTKVITGVPTAAVANRVVTITAKNSVGSVIQTFLMTVSPLPGWALGTFNGWYYEGREEVGVATLVVTSKGKISGKCMTGGETYTFKASSYAAGSSPATGFRFAGDVKGDGVTVPLAVTVRASLTPGGPASLGVAEGQLYGVSNGVAPLVFYRNVWSDPDMKPVSTNLDGYYTATLPGDGSFGSGYLAFTVKKGAVKTAGKLADGTSVSMSGAVLVDESNRCYTALYSAPGKYMGGSFFGVAEFLGQADPAAPVVIHPKDGAAFVWNNYDPKATGVYGEEFRRDIGLVGGWYDKLGNLYAYYQNKALTVDVGGNVPEIVAGGVRHESVFWDPSGRPLSVVTNSSGVMTGLTAEKVVGPVRDGAGWTYDSASNTVGLVFSLKRSTGIYKGSFKAWFDYGTTHTSKSIPFEGVLTPEREDKADGIEGRGYYLWPDTAPSHAFKWSCDFRIHANE